MFRRRASWHLVLVALACQLAETPSDARVIRKQADEQRLIGWLGEVPRGDSSGGSVPDESATGWEARKHGPKDQETDVVRDIFKGTRVKGTIRVTDVDEEEGTTTTTGDSDSDEDSDSYMDLSADPRIEKLSDSPRAYLFRNFLTENECDHLVTVGTPHLTRSTVVGTETSVTNEVRTSFGTFVPKNYDETFFGVEKKVQRFSNLPYENQEQLQLLRYRDGQEYKDHSDGLTSENGGKRVGTVLMFLGEPEVGGETCFPMAAPFDAVKQRLEEAHARGTLSQCAWRDGKGMAVQPKKGDAILFFSFRQDSDGKFTQQDPASTHASCPTRGGTKWTATKWIHESAFDTGVWQAPTCDDRVEQCANWAAAGECAKNPGFMLGGEVAGQCVKSCCANGEDVKMPEQLTAWQLEFCASCAGSRYEREFKEMRQSGSIGRGG